MSFNFAAYKKQKQSEDRSPALMLLLAGPQGGGKSFTAGTLPGDILYLHGSAESHGPEQARVMAGSRVTPMNWESGTPDESYKKLIDILSSDDLPKHFQSVVIDGLSDLTFGLMQNTSGFFDYCRTNNGSHSGFREGAAILELFKPITRALKLLQRSGVHTVTTMVLDVKQAGLSGEVEVAQPYVPTYGVATGLIPQFDDIAVVSYLNELPGSDKAKAGHYLQFQVNMKRVSKNEKQRIEKVFMINPRITGVKDTPAYASADLSKLAEFKKKNMEAAK